MPIYHTHCYKLQVVNDIVAIHTSVNIYIKRGTVLAGGISSHCCYQKDQINKEAQVLFSPRNCSVLTGSAQFTIKLSV